LYIEYKNVAWDNKGIQFLQHKKYGNFMEKPEREVNFGMQTIEQALDKLEQSEFRKSFH